MKGISTWIWVIGGVIISLILAMTFFKVFSNVTMEKHRQVSKTSFNKIVNNINSLCGMNEGEKITQRIDFSNVVSELYALSGDVLSEEDEKSYGEYACINISNQIICEEVNCPLEMIHLKQEETLLGIVDRLLGRIGYQDYILEFTRTDCGVSVLELGMMTSCACEWDESTLLITCEDQGRNPVLILEDNTTILTDITGWIDSDAGMLTLLNNSAHYLGGSNILIIWEDSIVDPTFPKSMLESEGSQVTVLRHTTSISTLDGYDQVWILNPGWCEHPIRKTTSYCIGTVDWQESEIDLMKQARDNGKGILLVTDSGVIKGKYGEIEFKAFNKILEILGFDFKQVKGCKCGCGTPDKISSIVKYHPLTQNIGDLKVKAVAQLSCIMT